MLLQNVVKVLKCICRVLQSLFHAKFEDSELVLCVAVQAHFLLELLQNVDDCQYPEGSSWSLSLIHLNPLVAETEATTR